MTSPLELLEGAAVEAHALRESVVFDSSAGDSITTLHERLVMLRKVQDRLEEITAGTGRLRAKCRAAMVQAQDAYDDKVSASIQGSKREEFSSAVERNSSYDLAAMDEKIVLRRAKRLLAQADEVFDYVNMRHRGVDSTRRDIDLRFRMMSFEMRLES